MDLKQLREYIEKQLSDIDHNENDCDDFDRGQLAGGRMAYEDILNLLPY